MWVNQILCFLNLCSMGLSQVAHSISKEGEICGGMMPVEMIRHCEKNLDCVRTHGPMIADAPGTCRPKCHSMRDDWGNCIPENCEVWNDGCNTCRVEENHKLACTKELCFDTKHSAKCERYSTDTNGFFHCTDYLKEIGHRDEVCCTDRSICLGGLPTTCSPECASFVNLLFTNCDGIVKQTGIDKHIGWDAFKRQCKKTSGTSDTKVIPKDCAVWFDGCNTCNVHNGKVSFCTKRVCLRLESPACQVHHSNSNPSHEHGKQCFDGVDNDHDSKKDCEDEDCKIYGHCRHFQGKEKGVLCFDGVDNDHDSKKDCEDEDCLLDPRIKKICQTKH
jgi:hypothetical protein